MSLDRSSGSVLIPRVGWNKNTCYFKTWISCFIWFFQQSTEILDENLLFCTLNSSLVIIHVNCSRFSEGSRESSEWLYFPAMAVFVLFPTKLLFLQTLFKWFLICKCSDKNLRSCAGNLYINSWLNMCFHSAANISSYSTFTNYYIII